MPRLRTRLWAIVAILELFYANTGAAPPDKHRPNARYAKPGRETSDKNELYQDLATNLKDHVNLTADPCTDFYEYACGNSKRDMHLNSAAYMLARQRLIEGVEEHKNSKSSFTQKAIQCYKTCLANHMDVCKKTDSFKTVKILMDNIAAATGFQFSIEDSNPKSQKLQPSNLGLALGMLSRYGVDTLITPTPNFNDHYLAFVKQSNLSVPYKQYLERPGKLDQYKKQLVDVITKYSKLNGESISPSALTSAVQQFSELEKRMFETYKYSEPPVEPCKYDVEKDTITFASIDFKAYFNGLICGTSGTCSRLGGQFALCDKESLKKLMQYVTSKFKPEVIMNYLFARLLLAKEELLVEPDKKCAKTTPKGGRGRGQADAFDEATIRNADAAIQDYCIFYLKKRLPSVIEQLETEEPEEEEAAELEELARDIWKNTETASIALLKKTFAGDSDSSRTLERIQKSLKLNVHFPKRFDDTTLDAHYSRLQFDKSDSFHMLDEKLNQFEIVENYPQFIKDWSKTAPPKYLPRGMQTYYYNNTVSVTWDVLTKLPFHPDYPPSVNYGMLAFKLGHERIHRLEPDSLPTGQDGLPRKVLDKRNEMKKCISEQYSQYCPLKGTGLKPECINGESTADENICDAGGLAIAYETYKAIPPVDAKKYRIPDPEISKLTQEQLFFLSYAQIYCRKPFTNAELKEVMEGKPKYSPTTYRLMGAIKNLPEFRKTFNCPPTKTPRRNANVCYIWQPKE